MANVYIPTPFRSFTGNRTNVEVEANDVSELLENLEMGAFLNPGNIGPKLDPAKPQVLIYEPVGDKLVLTAAEWFVPVAVAGGTAPSIFGQTLAGPMDGHEPIMPASLRHYDLHVWLWKDNPRGVFTSTNAAVKCDPKAPYTSIHGH